jgi:hypothetical protein
MLAYGWANTVPAASAADLARLTGAADAAALRPSPSASVVTLPTNPGRRHRPLSKETNFGAPVADPDPL